MKDNNDQVRAMHIRTSTHTTTRPVAKLISLEVQDRKQNDSITLEGTESINSDVGNEDIQKKADIDTFHTCLVREATFKAIQQMKKWNHMLGLAPEDI